MKPLLSTLHHPNTARLPKSQPLTGRSRCRWGMPDRARYREQFSLALRKGEPRQGSVAVSSQPNTQSWDQPRSPNGSNQQITPAVFRVLPETGSFDLFCSLFAASKQFGGPAASTGSAFRGTGSIRAENSCSPLPLIAGRIKQVLGGRGSSCLGSPAPSGAGLGLAGWHRR